MEPITLGVIAAALIAKSLDRVEDGALDKGLAVIRRSVESLRARFFRDDDNRARQALARVIEVPDSPKLVGALAELLDDRASRLPGLREELQRLVNEASDAGIDIDAIVQVAIGNQNIQMGNVSGSQINIDRGAETGPGS